MDNQYILDWLTLQLFENMKKVMQERTNDNTLNEKRNT